MIIRHPSTIAEVASALGISTKNARDLFTTSNIKINNFYKPCNTPLNFGTGPKNSLSDDERRSVNWGWNNLSGPDNSSDNLRLALMNKGQGKAWGKDLPTGDIGKSPYRMGDFNGYNTEAPMPFAMSLDKSEINSGEQLRIYIDNSQDELLQLHKWGFFAGINDINRIGFGVYVTNNSSNSISNYSQFTVCMIASYNGMTISDVLGNDKGFVIPAGYLDAVGISTGICYITPFLIRDSAALPYSDITTRAVVCNESTLGAMIFLQDRLTVTITGSGSGSGPSLDNATVRINSISYNQDIDVYVESVNYSVTINSSIITKVSVDIRIETGDLGDDQWAERGRTVTSSGSYTESFNVTCRRGSEARVQVRYTVYTAMSQVTSGWEGQGTLEDY